MFFIDNVTPMPNVKLRVGSSGYVLTVRENSTFVYQCSVFIADHEKEHDDVKDGLIWNFEEKQIPRVDDDIFPLSV